LAASANGERPTRPNTEGDAATFYPNGADVKGATPLDVTAGAEVDFAG
jgi:hypothetical protein